LVFEVDLKIEAGKAGMSRVEAREAETIPDQITRGSNAPF